MDNLTQTEAEMPEQKDPTRSDAKFLGWQKTRAGEPIALFNITAPDHPSFGSTVTEQSLQKMNLQVPEAPPPQEPVKGV